MSFASFIAENLFLRGKIEKRIPEEKWKPDVFDINSGNIYVFLSIRDDRNVASCGFLGRMNKVPERIFRVFLLK